jgi:hypothetical protein
MKPCTNWRLKTRIVLLSSVFAMPLLAIEPVSEAADNSSDQFQSLPEYPLQLAQGRQCKRQEGPFETQDTAWQRLRQAQGQGHAVSQGVIPCYDRYGRRGYCFYVFSPC